MRSGTFLVGTTIGYHGRADLEWSGILTRVGFTWFVK